MPGNPEYEIIGLGEVPEADNEVPGTLEIEYTYESMEVQTEQAIEVDLYRDLL